MLVVVRRRFASIVVFVVVIIDGRCRTHARILINLPHQYKLDCGCAVHGNVRVCWFGDGVCTLCT